METGQQVPVSPSPRPSRPFGLVILVLIVLLVGGYIWWQGRGDDCANWQADLRVAVEAAEDDPSQENAAHVVTLLSRRPEGCPQDLPSRETDS